MVDKTKSRVGISFALASAWFGTHCGSGFATGAQATSFWTHYGAWAFILPFISVAVMAIVAYFEWDFCRTFKTYDFKSFADGLFSPYDKVFSVIYSILFLGIMIMGVSSVFAGAGALLSQVLGIPYVAGVISIMAVTVFFTMFGSGFLLRSAAALSAILVGVITVVTIYGISHGMERLTQVAASWETQFDLLPAVGSAIFYGSFQCVILGSTVNISDGLVSRKDAVNAAIFGLLMNGVMMVLITYMLLAWYPEVNTEQLPVLAILSKTDSPLLQHLYSLMLLLAFITTAITCIGAILKRLEIYGANMISNVTTRRFVYSAALILACFAISQFGLLAIIRHGYSAIGYLGVPFVILPIVFIAPRKVSAYLRKNAAQ